MKWQRGRFKDKVVWIGVSEQGVFAATGGRVPMRYAKTPGSKVYQAGVTGISLDATHTPETLDAGVPADSAAKGAPKARGSGFGKAGTRSASQEAAARQDAKAKLAALGADVAVAYTDGGCRGNPGPAGSGVYLTLPDGRTAEASLALGRGTNNIAELSAIGLALDLLDQADWPTSAPVCLFSDSDYANGVLVRGWKAKANTELIVELRARLKRRPKVEVVWVAGHAGVAGNEKADQLASRGVSGTTNTTWKP